MSHGTEKAEASKSLASPVEHEGVVAETMRCTWSSEAAGTTTAAMNKLLGFDTKLALNKLDSITLPQLPEFAKASLALAKKTRGK